MAQQVAAMNNVAPNSPSIAPSTQNIRPLPYQNNTKQNSSGSITVAMIQFTITIGGSSGGSGNDI